MIRFLGLLLLGAAPTIAQAFEINGVALGASEAAIKRAMPSAYCRPLDWKSAAADRRCDDAKVKVGKLTVKVALYLKADSVQAFDVRFDTQNREWLAAHLKSRWGAPQSEATETVTRRSGGERQIYKVRWSSGIDAALLTAPLEQRRASLSAWRGDFRNEIYRVR